MFSASIVEDPVTCAFDENTDTIIRITFLTSASTLEKTRNEIQKLYKRLLRRTERLFFLHTAKNCAAGDNPARISCALMVLKIRLAARGFILAQFMSVECT